MREFPIEKAEVIKEYKRLHQLFVKDKFEFDAEANKAIENIINKAENEKRKSNLRKLQERWKETLMNASCS